MKKIRCLHCGFDCRKYGKTAAGKQRWQCKVCKLVFSNRTSNTVYRFKCFLQWLLHAEVQRKMPGEGRTFRRNTVEFWEIWPMPPKIDIPSDVVYVDGIYLSRKVCILICCDAEHILGWYICRSENSRAWIALLSRIATPKVVVSDGGTGFRKALKKAWPKAKLQRCTFHAFCQVKRYTTTKPKTEAGRSLYYIAKALLHIKSENQALEWIKSLSTWRLQYSEFLAEKTIYPDGSVRNTHERLIRAEKSLINLIKSHSLFTYLSKDFGFKCPAMNNLIEGKVNTALRGLLRNHRGLSIERRIKAVCWWCYMHLPRPLSYTEILKTMPTEKSISKIYNTMNTRSRLETIIPTWGDAIVWSDLHKSDPYPNFDWD